MFLFSFFEFSSFNTRKGFYQKKNSNSFKKKHFKEIFEHFKKDNFENSSFFIDHVILRNKYSNLISKKTIYSIYKKHFFDTFTVELCLSIFYSKKKKNFCLDVGTGGGFPGLLLSIFIPNFFFLLIESIKKKILFHRKILSNFNSSNCKSLSSRAEIIGKSKKHRGIYSTILARGVSELHFLVWFSFPLINFDGKIIILKQIFKIYEEIVEAKIDLQENKGKIKAIYHISPIKKGKMIFILKNENILF
jgi:16S rRNA (guanine527-N7)-methyltransferase